MNKEKKTLSQQEEAILKFWRERRIFEKSLAKNTPKGPFDKAQGKEFIFYEGPPTANGKPGIHHLEARAFKDAITRYKTMRGFYVRRKGGWDTHGLPVELGVEKELGLKSKKEIETYGIGAFNKKCRESVWRYIKEWEEFTDRIGYWIDLKRPYVTYKPHYIEAVWNIISKINERGLLYKDYKVVPWCPRCGTALSSHELAQGYETIKDTALTVKFQITNPPPAPSLRRAGKSQTNHNPPAGGQIPNGGQTYLLAWTTTPWTLPGNVALAVNQKIKYVLVLSDHVRYIVAKELVAEVFREKPYEISAELSAEELIGLEYEAPFPFLKDVLSGSVRDNPHANPRESASLENAFKVYAADFVTTEEGTGIVHTAVMYGQDDFELGTKVGLPKYHLVKEDGTFKEETGFLAGKFVKSEETDIEIIKDLAHRGWLFAKEKWSHSYPHCWRCATPLIYFARDSWYIAMSKLRRQLVKENQKINWEPPYIKDGRFGEWLKEVKDWAISRERYWGAPLPVWQCASCDKRQVVGSFEELFRRGKNKKLTRLVLVRHGESQKNIIGIFDSSRDRYPLTERGEKNAKVAAKQIKKMGGVDAIFASPVLRARQTAAIIGKVVGKEPVFSDALWEVKSGEWDGQKDSVAEAQPDRLAYNKLPHDIYYKTARGKTGESWQNVEDRVAAFAREILERHAGETIVIVSHEGPLMVLLKYLKGLSVDEITDLWEESRTFSPGLLGGFAEPTNIYVDARTGKEIDPHRPFIDDMSLTCECGNSSIGSGQGEMKRVKEVMDVWFDSGAMPFAQDADKRGWRGTRINADKKKVARGFFQNIPYPADFISEAIDQTRGWFYTLHAIGGLMGRGRAYKNVICLGHILDAEGKKMSKSLGNIVEPRTMIEKYGADALRFWMYSVNQPGEPKNFDEKTVDEVVRKVFNLASNVLAFYQLYADKKESRIMNHESRNALDRWILARLNQLIGEVTDGLERYKLLEPTRAIRDFIADLSQWYLRRSRERIKNGGEDGQAALAALGFVLCELSKIMAPFAPFFAEYLYQEVKGQRSCLRRSFGGQAKVKGFPESVHLEEWPQVESRMTNEELRVIQEMEEARRVVSLALEARAKANIKVRQPLASLRIKNHESRIMNQESLLGLIKDEVNVKEITLDQNLAEAILLDTAVTPELKEEGDVRELVRSIQELRKEAKLEPGERVRLEAAAEGAARILAEKYKETIMRQTNLSGIVFIASLEAAELLIGDMRLRLRIVK